jgi:hypothetical protein
MPADATKTKLLAAVEGLTYQSETDEPFEVLSWNPPSGRENITAASVLSLGKHKPKESVGEQSIEDFFAPLVKSETWHRDAERETVNQYQGLYRILKESLRDIRVFKVGSVQISIYIVGKAEDGHWVAIKTTAVET